MLDALLDVSLDAVGPDEPLFIVSLKTFDEPLADSWSCHASGREDSPSDEDSRFPNGRKKKLNVSSSETV